MRLRRPPVAVTPPNADEASWALVEIVHDGRPMWVRRNLAIEPRLASPSHPLLLSVRVTGDLTDPELLARLGGFEDALFGILGHDDLCWAAAVVTTTEDRTFLLFARERESLAPPLAFLRREFPLAFELALVEDPDRSVFRRLPGRPRV